jgi:hypothetical protein
MKKFNKPSFPTTLFIDNRFGKANRNMGKKARVFRLSSTHSLRTRYCFLITPFYYLAVDDKPHRIKGHHYPK